MVRSATPPPLFEEPEPEDMAASFTGQFNDFISQIVNVDEVVEPTPGIDTCDENGMGSAVLNTAENCAAKMLRMVMRMSQSDLAGFWYPCMPTLSPGTAKKKKKTVG